MPGQAWTMFLASARGGGSHLSSGSRAGCVPDPSSGSQGDPSQEGTAGEPLAGAGWLPLRRKQMEQTKRQGDGRDGKEEETKTGRLGSAPVLGEGFRPPHVPVD